MSENASPDDAPPDRTVVVCPRCNGCGWVERHNLFGMPVVTSCPAFCRDADEPVVVESAKRN